MLTMRLLLVLCLIAHGRANDSCSAEIRALEARLDRKDELITRLVDRVERLEQTTGSKQERRPETAETPLGIPLVLYIKVLFCKWKAFSNNFANIHDNYTFF